MEVIRWGVRYAEMARSWGIASDKIRESQKTQSKTKQRAMSQKEPWIPGGHMAVLRNGSLSFLWPNIEFSVC